MTFPFPIELYDPTIAEQILMTPAAFRRIWFHTTDVKSEICLTGWNPEAITRSMYGSAVYLARRRWNPDDHFRDLLGPPDREALSKDLRSPTMIACVLMLQNDEVMSCFPLPSVPDGNSEQDLLNYLNKNVPQDETAVRRGIRRVGTDGVLTSLRFSKAPVLGSHEKNKQIARHFLNRGKKAIRFLEHSEEVVAVFDPSCIRVLPTNTGFEDRPFSILLAANEVESASL